MNAQAKGTRTYQVLMVMKVFAIIGFVGLAVEAGGIATTYVVSCINPLATQKMYIKLNMESLQTYSFMHYTFAVSFKVALLSMKAYALILLTKALSKVNLQNSFRRSVANTLEKMSHILIGLSAVGLLANIHSEWVEKMAGIAREAQATEEFLFAAGLVFIISQVFKRGVELQSENELTV